MKKKHYLLIAALSLSLTTAAAATLTACGEDDPAYVQVTENLTGTYYVDDNGVEKTIVMGLNSFTLDFGDGEKTGWYDSCESGTVNLVFDNSETATAVFDSGILTLNYNGRTYVMYIKSNFTVRFDVDNGTAVDSQTVVNGRKASRPATNPTREGSVFIGWYTDSSFAKPFDFNTQITSNTTIYAKFITIDDNLGVYQAKFDLGEGVDNNYPAVATLNRVLYNLPEAPSKDGKKFLGWWVSNYNDRTKLSSKYEGQEIYENTVLYAVWESDSPAISVTPEGASWTAKGSNVTYSVCIKDAGGNVVGTPQTSGSTSIAFNFGAAAAGDYTVEVTVGENTTVAYYKNKALARVDADRFNVEDNYFGFLAIETPDPNLEVKYYLDLECGGVGHSHVHEELSATGFDFSNCAMKAGGIKFKITAEADGYVASVSEEYTLERTLGEVNGLTVDAEHERVVWDAVANAKTYNLELSNGTDTPVTVSVTGTSYDIRNFDPAEWTIKVTPFNQTYNTPAAAQYSYTKTRLASPTNFTASDYITWDKVNDATGYILYINGVAQPTLDADINTFEVTRDLFGELNKEYAVTVVALGATAAENSLASNPVYIHDQLGAITYADGVVSWDAVLGITKYGVKVGEGEEIFVTDGSNRAEITFKKSGPTVITVTCYVGDGEAAGSNTVSVEVYAVIFNTLGGSKVENQYKVDGDTLSLPQDDPSRLGYTFLGWFNQVENGTKYNDKTFTFDSSNQNIYANWQANKYRVTLIVGANGTMEEETEYEVTFGEAFKFPAPTSIDEDKEFTGWFTAATGGIRCSDNLGFTQSGWNIANHTTLRAQWGNAAVSYTLINGSEYAASRGAGSSGLTTVAIRATYKGLPVTKLVENAFNGCTSVKTLRIPSTIKSIATPSGGPYASGSSFYGLNNLENIEVYDVENENGIKEKRNFASENGCLYTVDEFDELNELVFIPKTKDKAGTFTIADGAKQIGIRAFNGMNQITEVVIPASVTNIADGAFQSASQLSTVTFLPAANGEMGEELTVGSSFNYCHALKQITFPKRLVSLDASAFDYSTALTDIYIQELGETKDRTVNYYDLDGVLCKSDELVCYRANRTATSYQIPAGISRIGDKAFYNCDNLTRVTFTAAITKIGVEAFRDCDRLDTINFDPYEGNEDLEICEKAFYNCNSLESVVLPANLKTLRKGAFGYTDSLTSVTVNANCGDLTYEDGAFGYINTNGTINSSYDHITDVHLGANVAKINISAVFGSKIETIEVADGNANFLSLDNVIYNGDGTEILFFPNDKTAFVLSDHLKTVTASTFKGKTLLTSITIGTGVTTIEDSAFEGCTGLEEVIFKEGGTEKLDIGNRAFYGCNMIRTLTLAGRDGAEITLGDSVFAGGNNILSTFDTVTLPEGVTKIGKSAFASRSMLKAVNLPSTLSEIGAFAVNDFYPSNDITFKSTTRSDGKILAIGVDGINIFDGCSNLETITVADGNAKFASIDGVLYGKEDNVITTVLFSGRANKGGVMPEATTDEGEQEKEYGYLEVPATVNKVSDYAFYNNAYIKKIVFLGDHESFTFGNWAFFGCQMRSFNVPVGVETLPEGVFASCGKLTEVEISNTVNLIQQYAFKSCSQLTDLKFATGNDENKLVIEDGTYTGASGQNGGSTCTGAFTDCGNLATVEFPARLKEIGAYSFRPNTTNANGVGSLHKTSLTTVKIPVGTERIGTGAFQQCTKLTNVSFTGDVTEDTPEMTIESSAFSKCGITSITLPENLTKLGMAAFEGTQLTSLTLPAGLETLESLASYSDSGTRGSGIETLETVTFSYYTDEETGEKYNNITTLADKAFEGQKNLTAVEGFEYCTNLTAVPNGLFMNTGITSITLPGTVTSIGISAFDKSKLESFAFPEDEDGNNIVTYIGDYAFRKTALEEFVFPTLAEGDVTLGKNLFEGCAALTDITISASVQDIGSAFAKMPNLQEITVEDGSGVNIDAKSHLIFSKNEDNGTYKITSAYGAVPLDKNGKFSVPKTFKDGTIDEIADRAFIGQNAVKTIVIPNTILKIGDEAFWQCLGLETVEFEEGSTLYSIGDRAFQYTMSFDRIELPDSVKELGLRCFNRSHVRTVRMPNELTFLGERLFDGCCNLETVNNFPKLRLSRTAQYYDGQFMFFDCYNLKTVTFAAGADTLTYKPFYECNALEKLDISNITTFLGYYTNATTLKDSDGVFYSCKNLKEVVLNGSIRSLPAGMFNGCSSLTTVYRSDTPLASRVKDKVDISQIESFIAGGTGGTGAFKNCSSIITVDARNAKEFNTEEIFSGCSSLKKVTIGKGQTTFKKKMFYNCTALKTINYWDEGNHKIVGKDREVTLPDEMNFLGVNTFEGTGIEKVTLPLSMEVIGSSATAVSSAAALFLNCAALREVILPSGLTKIGAETFKGCKSLSTIKVRSGDEITGKDGEVTLPTGLVSVGNYAFMQCAITSIDLSNVTEIGTTGSNSGGVATGGMFFECKNLKSVKLNDNITVLGQSMFAYCTSLESIKLPSSLKATNICTFYGSGIKSIELPSGVVYLGVTSATSTSMSATSNCYVFAECKNLETVTVSANFQKMGKWAFKNCEKLRTFTVELEEVTDPETHETVKKPKATKLNQVGQEAFLGCKALETIDLSKVTATGTLPFSGCTSLKEADLSAATNTTLQEKLFEGCSSLEKVKLNSSITTLKNYMFRNCSSLESIDLSNVTNVATYAFSGCSKLTTVTLKSNLTTLGDYTFNGCSLLSTIYKGAPADAAAAEAGKGKADLSGITTMGTHAFDSCKALEEVTLNDNLTTLGDSVFSSCSALRVINMPSKLTTISGSAFFNCFNLESLEIPASVASIGANLFIGCSKLKLTVAGANANYEINSYGWLVNKKNGAVLFIPPKAGSEAVNVTEISFADGAQLYSYMFNGYSAVEKITLPSDLTSIPNYAFWSFKGSFGEDFAIPAGVTSIGAGAFQNCAKLTEIVIPEGVTSIGANAFQNCANLTKLTLPSTITSIGANAFDGCAKLSEIVFPTVTEESENATGLTIGNYAFKGCVGLNGAMQLPDGIISLGEGAFQGCTGILGLSFGKYLYSVGASAFDGCNSLIAVHFEEGLNSIGDRAFAKLNNLQTVNIPYTVTSIGVSAFMSCPNLATVTFDETPEDVTPVAITFGVGSRAYGTNAGFVDEIGYDYTGVFAGCTALKSIVLPDRMTAIAANAFAGSGLESVTLPKNLGQIGNYAFLGTPLKSLTIPYTVTTLGTAAFGLCRELTSLTFEETPEGVDPVNLTIAAGASGATTSATGCVVYDEATEKYYSGVFIGASKLGEVTLPSRLVNTTKYSYTFAFSGVTKVKLSGVALVGDYMFYHCPNLTDVDMPDGTTEIGQYAFTDCALIEDLQLAKTITKIGSDAFNGTAVREIVITMNFSWSSSGSSYSFRGLTSDQKVLIDITDSDLLTLDGQWNENTRNIGWTSATFGVIGGIYGTASSEDEAETTAE